MAKYKVSGTITYQWEKTVEADSEQEARQTARGYAEDGWADLSGPTEKPEIDEVEEVA